MAENYSVTSFQALNAEGKPAALGPFGVLVLDKLVDGYGDGWIDVKEAQGVSDSFTFPIDVVITNLLTACLTAYPEIVVDDYPETLKGLLELVKDKYPSLTPAMVEKAAQFDAAGDIHLEDLLYILHDEQGADIASYSLETGSWCDKNRFGAFGGHGFYRGQSFHVSSSSQDAIDIGAGLDHDLAAGNVAGAAETLLANTLKPILDSMTDEAMKEKFQQALVKELITLVGIDSSVLIEVTGGVVTSATSDLPGFSYEVRDNDLLDEEDADA